MPTDITNLINALPPQSSGLVAMAFALIYIAKLIRTDSNRRQDRSIRRMGRRLGRLEGRCEQLGTALKARGVDLPPWPEIDEEDQADTYQEARA